jgi:hypothetical protein
MKERYLSWYRNGYTERLEAEQKLLKVNRLYSFISQINQVIVRATNEEMLLKKLVL